MQKIIKAKITNSEQINNINEMIIIVIKSATLITS